MKSCHFFFYMFKLEFHWLCWVTSVILFFHFYRCNIKAGLQDIMTDEWLMKISHFLCFPTDFLIVSWPLNFMQRNEQTSVFFPDCPWRQQKRRAWPTWHNQEGVVVTSAAAAGNVPPPFSSSRKQKAELQHTVEPRLTCTGKKLEPCIGRIHMVCFISEHFKMYQRWSLYQRWLPPLPFQCWQFGVSLYADVCCHLCRARELWKCDLSQVLSVAWMR